MSNDTAMALLLSATIGGGALLLFLSRTLNQRMDVILTGMLNGSPIDVEHRRMMLYHMYFQFLGAIIALSAVLTVVVLRVSALCDDPATKTVGYIVAILAAGPGFNWSILGSIAGVRAARVLRKTEADQDPV